MKPGDLVKYIQGHIGIAIKESDDHSGYFYVYFGSSCPFARGEMIGCPVPILIDFLEIIE